jgi:hypothetical protein
VLDAVAVFSFYFELLILRLSLNTCRDFRFSMNIFVFRLGVFAQCEIGQSRRYYYPIQGVTELCLKYQSEIRPMQVPIFKSPKSGDRFGRKNRRAGIDVICFNFYSPLHLTVRYKRRAVHLQYGFIIYQVIFGCDHSFARRSKAGACRLYVVGGSYSIINLIF